MRYRDLLLDLDKAPGGTLIQRLSRAIEAAIREGRLKPGVALPGSRALATDLGLTRNTVVAALDALVEEGWLVSEPNRGTFVALKPPLDAAAGEGAADKPSAPGFELPSQLRALSDLAPESLVLSDGLPDPRLAPTEELAKAYQRALRRHGDRLLQYGEPMGNTLLREAIAEWATERHGVAVGAESVLITRGSRMALTLISLALLRPGDAVAVEEPGNRGAWTILQQCSDAKLLPVPVDREGIRLDALEPLLAQGGVRALYLTPRRQFPTGASMGAARAQALLELAVRHRVAVLEDDYDAAYHYGEARPASLLGRDGTGQVVHLGSLSRLLAPGIRLGFIIAPKAVVKRLATVRRNMEWQGDRVLEWAIADLIRDGELARHLRRVRRVYAERRDLLVEGLRRELGAWLDVEAPDGGLGLWLRVKGGLDPEAWVEAAKEQGLSLNPPRHFHLGEPGAALRLGFSQLDERESARALERLKQAAERALER